MNSHKNARLTYHGRVALIQKIQQVGMPQACQAMAVSTVTGHKWLKRYKLQGLGGLHDRSSRPRRCRNGCSLKAARAVQLRKNHSLGYREISLRIGLPCSTVGRLASAQACTAKRIAKHLLCVTRKQHLV